MIVDDHPKAGGHLRASRTVIDGNPALDWVASIVEELDANPEVTRLHDAVVWGYRESNQLIVTERNPDEYHVFQRGWRARAKRVILATGAIERNLIFANNDRPGIMLASAVQRYVNEYAVEPGRRAMIFTNNSSAYALAHDLQAIGMDVAGIVDSRPSSAIGREQHGLDIPLFAGHQVMIAHGSKMLQAVTIKDKNGITTRLDCDLLAVSGGWNPAVHLFSQSRGTLVYDDDLASFVPDKPSQQVISVGAAAGKMNLASAIAETATVTAACLEEEGFLLRLLFCPYLRQQQITIFIPCGMSMD